MSFELLGAFAIGLSWVTTVVAGLLSILTALLRRKVLSWWSSRICLDLSLAVAVICMFLIGEELPSIGYAIISAPAGLGLVGNLIRKRQPDEKPMRAGQFPISVVLFIITVIAMCLGAVAAIRHASVH